MALPRVLTRVTSLVNKTSVFTQFSAAITINKFIHTSNCVLAERLFTSKHEWVEIDGKTGVIGISQYAQEALGDVVYAQLPDVDTLVKKTDECGALESVKAASEIYSPVSGKVIAKNTHVEETPSLINTSCYEKGWLFKVELKDDEDLKDLMSEAQYKEFLKTQHHD